MYIELSAGKRFGRSGDRIPVGSRFPAPVRAAHPAPFLAVKAVGAWRWPPTLT